MNKCKQFCIQTRGNIILRLPYDAQTLVLNINNKRICEDIQNILLIQSQRRRLTTTSLDLTVSNIFAPCLVYEAKPTLRSWHVIKTRFEHLTFSRPESLLDIFKSYKYMNGGGYNRVGLSVGLTPRINSRGRYSLQTRTCYQTCVCICLL